MSADQVRPLGLGALYTRNERTWPVSPWTYGIQGNYTLYLQDKTLQKIRELERRGYLTPDEAKEQKREVSKDPDYIFGSPYVMESFQRSRENLAYLFWLQVSEGAKDFTLAQSRQLVEEDGEGVVEAVARANAAPEDNDPNRTTPEKPGIGSRLTSTSSVQP